MGTAPLSPTHDINNFSLRCMRLKNERLIKTPIGLATNISISDIKMPSPITGKI
jgi:hypothetical protein